MGRGEQTEEERGLLATGVLDSEESMYEERAKLLKDSLISSGRVLGMKVAWDEARSFIGGRFLSVTIARNSTSTDPNDGYFQAFADPKDLARSLAAHMRKATFGYQAYDLDSGPPGKLPNPLRVDTQFSVPPAPKNSTPGLVAQQDLRKAANAVLKQVDKNTSGIVTTGFALPSQQLTRYMVLKASPKLLVKPLHLTAVFVPNMHDIPDAIEGIRSNVEVFVGAYNLALPEASNKITVSGIIRIITPNGSKPETVHTTYEFEL